MPSFLLGPPLPPLPFLSRQRGHSTSWGEGPGDSKFMGLQDWVPRSLENVKLLRDAEPQGTSRLSSSSAAHLPLEREWLGLGGWPFREQDNGSDNFLRPHSLTGEFVRRAWGAGLAVGGGREGLLEGEPGRWDRRQ